jgi:hypothetical protein
VVYFSINIPAVVEKDLPHCAGTFVLQRLDNGELNEGNTRFKEVRDNRGIIKANG